MGYSPWVTKSQTRPSNFHLFFFVRELSFSLAGAVGEGWCCAACGILVSQLGMEPMPAALEA